MDPVAVGTRLASSVAAPLVRKLFVTEGPGAGLVDKPVRISAFVSFKGEKRVIGEKELAALSAELVGRAMRAGERPIPADEEQAVVHALAATLYGLGDLTMTDIQAVELGHRALALHLRAASGNPDRDLSFDATLFYEGLLDTACLHILHFFTQRSTFVARTLVEHSRRQRELIAKVDELIARTPMAGGTDQAFEQRYLAHVATKHSHLTIYGIDLVNSPERWPLDAAYLSLQAVRPGGDEETASSDGVLIAAAGTSLPAEQALSEQDLVLLRGVAGSGKTTLVQWLAVTAARGERGDRIPFVLPLRTLVRRPDGLPSPDAFLSAVRVPFHATQPGGWTDRVLGQGRGLLLVDGLDEIPERDRERTRRWLRELLDAYPGNQWLVTSRPSAVREDWLAPDGFTELVLAPMTGDDVAAFIRRWHAAARPDASDTDRLDGYERSLLDAVRTKPDLGRLATNPLMCGLICALHHDRRGYLPHGRQELYDAALSMLLSRRDEERDMFPRGGGQDGIHLTELPQIQLLQRLAYWLIRNGRVEMDRERAERIVADVLPSLPAAAHQGDASQVLRHLIVRSGLLREPTLGTVEFVHRTFQDYLGAKAAVEDGDFGLLVRNAGESQWADVIRMSVAHARPRERADLLGAMTDSATRLDGASATRVRLLALASLEHATQLAPEVRAAVEGDAAALIPPRTSEEARALAEAGPLVLELLPGPEGLTEAEARGVVVTASLIGTDAAVPVLARFRSHPALSVRAQLTWGWHRFDTERYASDVVAHLDPAGLYFTAHSTTQLRVLRDLGGRSMLQIVGDFGSAELRSCLPPDQVTHLVLRYNNRLRDLDFLAAQPRLEQLNLDQCQDVEDLSPLAALPLRALSLLSAGSRGRAPEGLPALSSLRELNVGHRLAGRSLTETLPLDAPLEVISFGLDVLRDTGMRGLRHWESLHTLWLSRVPGELSPADWSEVAALPGLRELRIHRAALGSLGSAPALPGVEHLELRKLLGNEDLSGLRSVVPNLRTVNFVLNSDTGTAPEHLSGQLPGEHTTTRTHNIL
ncbi:MULTISPECIES: NACHT domain-containing NTPase [unclassified Streptomyces]|uniref:NACHT domain-containing protein n=1 Tax=unclassified Streptomyces TaxID=2593676 RepID=UPI002258C1E5|nr:MULTISPECIES: NACHT domain-containing protein [unclassified Streptomyces]MCX4989369.1 NACHT domain-containing protein [Streptomyces sp. NBC_00568]MCX5005409.1 NACHT domain-containing protein [Streptomyces sp. NBC_00638]